MKPCEIYLTTVLNMGERRKYVRINVLWYVNCVDCDHIGYCTLWSGSGALFWTLFSSYLLVASPDGWAVWGVVVSTRWWLLVDHCVLRNWDRILVRAVKGFISRAGMVSICPLLWQRDVKLQQTKPMYKLYRWYTYSFTNYEQIKNDITILSHPILFQAGRSFPVN